MCGGVPDVVMNEHSTLDAYSCILSGVTDNCLTGKLGRCRRHHAGSAVQLTVVDTGSEGLRFA